MRRFREGVGGATGRQPRPALGCLGSLRLLTVGRGLGLDALHFNLVSLGGVEEADASRSYHRAGSWLTDGPWVWGRPTPAGPRRGVDLPWSATAFRVCALGAASK